MFLVIAALAEEVSGILRAGQFRRVDSPDGMLAYQARGGVGARVDTALVLTGAGRERAARVARWGISKFKPESIISLGFGGGTRDTSQPGDMVLATGLYRLDGSPFYWDKEQLGDPILPDRGLLRQARNAVEVAGIDFELGPVLSLPTVARTAEMKRWLGKELGAGAIDMESFIVAELAQDEEIPFVVVRAVVDPAAVDLPELVGRVDQAPSGGRLIPALRYVVRRPWEVARLIRLSGASARARRVLTTFFTQLEL